MKNRILFLSIILSVSVYGQKQKDLNNQIDTLTKANASLTESNKLLTAKSDSLNTSLTSYINMYNVIRDSIIEKEFDPNKTDQLIDSVFAVRDSVISPVADAKIKELERVNDSLWKENEGLLFAVNLLKGGDMTKELEMTDFSGVWKMTMRKVQFIGTSPNSALIDISSDPILDTAPFLERNSIAKINFIDTEAAELTFSNGEIGKCYYAIYEFNKEKPYYIEFKGIKADFRMYIMNTNAGPRVSFQVPTDDKVFYFGQMTR